LTRLNGTALKPREVVIPFPVKKKPKERIETNANAQPLAGLAPALENLNVPLPENVNSARPTSTEPVWKMGRVLLRRETAHRGGKTVVVVYDFATHLPASIIEKVAKKLRAACSTGGTGQGSHHRSPRRPSSQGARGA
jgi:translation initiation factor 1 (eIF-1/SUI1)